MKQKFLIAGKNIHKKEKIFENLKIYYDMLKEDWSSSNNRSTTLKNANIIYTFECIESLLWYIKNKYCSQKIITEISESDLKKNILLDVDWNSVDLIIFNNQILCNKFKHKFIASGISDEKLLVLDEGIYIDSRSFDKIEGFEYNIGILDISNLQTALDFIDNQSIKYKIYIYCKLNAISNNSIFKKIIGRLNIDIFIIENNIYSWYSKIGYVIDINLSYKDIIESISNGCIPIILNKKRQENERFNLIFNDNIVDYSNVNTMELINSINEENILFTYCEILKQHIDNINFTISVYSIETTYDDVIDKLNLKRNNNKLSVTYTKYNNNSISKKYSSGDKIVINNYNKIVKVCYGKNLSWMNITFNFNTILKNIEKKYDTSVNELLNYKYSEIVSNIISSNEFTSIHEIKNSRIILNTDIDLINSSGIVIMISNIINILMSNNNSVLIITSKEIPEKFLDNLVYNLYEIIVFNDNLFNILFMKLKLYNYLFLIKSKIQNILSFSNFTKKVIVYDTELTYDNKILLQDHILTFITQNENNYKETILNGVKENKIIFEKFSYKYKSTSYTNDVHNIIYCNTIKEDDNIIKMINDFELAKISNNITLTICYGKIEGTVPFIKLIKQKINNGIHGITFKYGLSYREKCIEMANSNYGLCWMNNDNQDKYNQYDLKILHNFDEFINKPIINNNYLSQISLKFIIFVSYCEIFKPYIVECLNSIVSQNYINYEVVIVNDGDQNVNNIKIIETFISNKDNFNLINFNNNNGPAYSKAMFVKYIQENLGRKYGLNDIILIIDGDDYLIDKNALLKINSVYLEKKCWFTVGNYCGKWNDDMKNNYNNFINMNSQERRKSKKCYLPHPRSFKAGLCNFIDISIFKYNNKYLRRCTDLVLLMEILELCGPSKIQFIDEKLYYYRDHNNNGYKTVETNEKNLYLNYIANKSCRIPIKPDLHVILATYKRKNLNEIFKMLQKQDRENIVLHLLDNNEDIAMNMYVTSEINKFKDQLKILLYRYNFNYHCFSRIYIVKEILKKYLVDYIVIFDDDQIFDTDWCTFYEDNALPQTVNSWYGKNILNNHYFESSIPYHFLIQKKDVHVKEFEYFGPGGAIIDANLFCFNELYNFLNYSSSIIQIDDIWMSFVFSKFLNIPFNRLLYPPKLTIGRSDLENTTWHNIKNEKQKLLDLFINKYSWKLSERSSFITINSYFDFVYILNLKNDKIKRKKIMRQFKELGIIGRIVEAYNGFECPECVKYVEEYQKRKPSDKFLHKKQLKYWNPETREFDAFLIRNPGTMGIIKSMISIFNDAIKNNYKNILVFQDDVLFDKQFVFKFNQFITSFDEDWEILNLGTNQTNHDYELIKSSYYYATTCTYGSFAQGYTQDVIRRILPRLEKPNISFDKLLAEEFREKYICIYPSICIQDITKSSSGMQKRDLIQKINDYDPEKLKWNINNINFIQYWDIKIYILKNNTETSYNFNYLNYVTTNNIIDIPEKSYILWLNGSKNIFYDKNLIGKMLLKIKKTQTNEICSDNFLVNNLNHENCIDLFDSYMNLSTYNSKYDNEYNIKTAILFKDKSFFKNYDMNETIKTSIYSTLIH